MFQSWAHFKGTYVCEHITLKNHLGIILPLTGSCRPGCATYAHEDIMLQKLLPAGSVIFTKSSYSAPVNKTSCGLPYAYVVLQIAICNLEIMIFFFVCFC